MTATAPLEYRSVDWPDGDAPSVIQRAGVAGAGGGGFPSYAKWAAADSAEYLLMNHQESEPNYRIDKWLGREHAAELASLFDAVLDQVFEVVVVGAKRKDRDPHMRALEAHTNGTVRMPEELPLDPDAESGVVFAYTDNEYQYGMESVLLQTVAGTVIGNDLPIDHGWVVQNTESLYNIHQAVTAGKQVLRKYVHVDGVGLRHRFLDVPIGTPASVLVEAAGRDPETIGTDAVLANGGPGWCFAIDEAPSEFGVRKQTNCLLVLDRETAEQNRLGESRIDALDAHDWLEQQIESEPTAQIEPEFVRVPLITNPELAGTVQPSEPTVSVGNCVETGDVIAAPAPDGVSTPTYASIDGTVTDIDDQYITIHR